MQLINETALAEMEKALGFENLKDEVRATIHQDFINVISGRAAMRIVKNLSEKEAKAFNVQAQNATQAEISELLLAKAPNAKEIFQEELERLRIELEGTEN